MTLVVARVIDASANPSVRILSDWKVTYPDPRRGTPFTGALKAIALSRDLAAAYSTNNVDAALAVIRTAVKACSTPDALALAEVLRPHTQDDQHEFLVASRSTMHVVREGAVLPNQLVANLGDRNAFDEYQRHFHERVVFDTPALGGFSAEFFSTISRMSNGFEGVLRGERFPGVAPFQITLTSRSSKGEGFRYLASSAGSDFHSINGSPEPQSLLAPKPASGGGYNYSILVPEECGVGAIGFHILQGKVGGLVRPLESDCVVEIPAATAQEFVAVVRQRFSLQLTGLPWSGSSES